MEAQPLGKGAEGRGRDPPAPQPPMPRAESWNLPLRTRLLLLYECGEPRAQFLLRSPLSPSPYPPPRNAPHTGGLGPYSPQTGIPGQSQLMPLSANPCLSLDSYPVPGASDWDPPTPAHAFPSPLPVPPHPQHVVLVFSYRCSQN